MARKEVEDLTGRTFGRWTVLGRAEDRYDKRGGRHDYWNCKCSCGTEKEVNGRELKRGRSNSCGCSKKELKPVKSIVGNKYGRWTVLQRGEDRLDKNGHVLRTWLCECECGTKKEVFEGALKNNGSKSCGCLQKDVVSNLHIDMNGKKFGRWTVLEKAFIKNDSYYWKCQCDCGTIRDVNGVSLRNGTSVSCGCYNIERTKESQKLLRKYNEYDLSKEYGIGWTSNTNKEFYFDLEDYEKIKDYLWYEKEDGYIISHTRGENSKNIRMNRLVMDVIGEEYSNIFIDHINHNIKDNRKCNLRETTTSQNSRNHKLFSTNSSGHTGIYYDERRGCWLASITHNYKSINLGGFDDIEDAIKARKQAEEKYFGEYSYDNSMAMSKNI